MIVCPMRLLCFVCTIIVCTDAFRQRSDHSLDRLGVGEESFQWAQARKQWQLHQSKTSLKNVNLEDNSREEQLFGNTTQSPLLALEAAKALKKFKRDRAIQNPMPLTPERKRQIEEKEAALQEMENQQTTIAVDEETPPIEPIIEDEAIEPPILPLKQVAKAIRKFKLKIARNSAIPLTLKRKLEIEAEEAVRKTMEIEEEITTMIQPTTTGPAIWRATTTLPDVVPIATTSTPELKAMAEFFPPPPTGPSCTSAR